MEGLFSLRIGDMRAVYELDSRKQVIVVHAIGPRGDIYKKQISPWHCPAAKRFIIEVYEKCTNRKLL